MYLGFFIFLIMFILTIVSILGIIRIVQEYKKQKSRIENEPDWVSWFYFLFITLWGLIIFVGLINYFVVILIIGPILVWCCFFAMKISKKYGGNTRTAMIFGLFGVLTFLLYWLVVRAMYLEKKKSPKRAK